MSHSTLRESAMGRRLGVSSEAALRACLFALSLAQTTATFIEDIPCDVGWRTALFQKLARQHALLSNAYKLQQWLLMPLWAGLGFASFLSLEKRVIDAFLLPGLAGFASDGSAQAQVAALARLVLAFLSRAIGALPAWLLAYPRSRIALFAFAWSTGAAVARLAWRLRDNAKALLAADHAAWRRDMFEHTPPNRFVMGPLMRAYAVACSPVFFGADRVAGLARAMRRYPNAPSRPSDYAVQCPNIRDIVHSSSGGGAGAAAAGTGRHDQTSAAFVHALPLPAAAAVVAAGAVSGAGAGGVAGGAGDVDVASPGGPTTASPGGTETSPQLAAVAAELAGSAPGGAKACVPLLGLSIVVTPCGGAATSTVATSTGAASSSHARTLADEKTATHHSSSSSSSTTSHSSAGPLSTGRARARRASAAASNSPLPRVCSERDRLVVVREVTAVAHRHPRAMLFVGNHALLGLELAPLMWSIHEGLGVYMRGLAHTGHFDLPVWARFVRWCGGIPGTRDGCSDLLNHGHPVLVYPGGSREVMKTKGSPDYQLVWGDRAGFAKLALQSQAIVVPLGHVGSNEMFTHLGDIPFTWLFGARRRVQPTVPVLGDALGSPICAAAQRSARSFRRHNGAVSTPSPAAAAAAAAAPSACGRAAGALGAESCTASAGGEASSASSAGAAGAHVHRHRRASHHQAHSHHGSPSHGGDGACGGAGADSGPAREEVTLPVLLPTSPQRFYFSFGKPIDTAAWGGRMDEEACLQLRDVVKAAIEGEIRSLRTYQAADPDRYLLSRAWAGVKEAVAGGGGGGAGALKVPTPASETGGLGAGDAPAPATGDLEVYPRAADGVQAYRLPRFSPSFLPAAALANALHAGAGDAGEGEAEDESDSEDGEAAAPHHAHPRGPRARASVGHEHHA